jgi:hypothetical protein
MDQMIDKEKAISEKKSELNQLLREHAVEVTFTKVSGEVRVMPCTLKESLIPAQPVHVTNTDNPIDFPKVKREKKENPDVISAYCLDKKEWRSFRVANVTNVRILND